MANNLVEYLAQLKAKDPKRANWLFDCSNIGTNTFGFIKPKLVKEIIAGSHVTYDFKSAYSSNPTISPVLSRAKVSVCAIWVPLSLYVPALRDGVQVKAGKDDYSFPTINFDYSTLRSDYLTRLSTAQHDYANATNAENAIKLYEAINGKLMPYIPSNSIFSELRMWRPGFNPSSFAVNSNPDEGYPEAKNAIPLLGYYDFYRSYILNSQVDYTPMRIRGYNVQRWFTNRIETVTQDPIDSYVSRDHFDNFFKQVRSVGSSYPNNGQPFDISQHLTLFLYGYNQNNGFAPTRSIYMQDGVDENGVVSPRPLLFNDDHYGELRAPYFADYNTAFLSNENVEYERSTARVQADDDGIITMEQIYHAQKVQNFIRRTVFKNSDYAEFIDSQYGITPPTNLTKPLFLGKVSTWLSFNDVVSQAQTSDDNDVDSNTALGSRSSLGFGRMVTGKLRGKDDRHFVSFTAKEPGYLMVLEWIVPEVSYFQGFDPLYDKRSLGSLFFPAFDKDGYQDKQFKYLNEQVVNPNYGTAGMPPFFNFKDYNAAVAQEPAWWEYMTTHNVMSGQMVNEGVYRHWVFHREYDPIVSDGNDPIINNENFLHFSPTNISEWAEPPMLVTNNIYVTPEDFTHIFANEQGLDNFQTFYKHDIKIYQPLSHRFLSF